MISVFLLVLREMNEPFYGAVSLDRQVSGEVRLPQLSFLQQRKVQKTINTNFNNLCLFLKGTQNKEELHSTNSG